MDTRYQPSSTAPQIVVATSDSRSLRALSLGLLVSTGANVAMALAVTMLYRLVLPKMMLPMNERLPLLMQVSPHTYLFVWMSLAGLWWSAVGGYVCARVARARNYFLGLSLACLTELCRVILFPQTGHPQAIFMILAMLTIACVLLGTALGLDRTRS